jgi:hypothetical protein
MGSTSCALVAFVALLGQALAGAHDLPRLRAVAAVAVALVIVDFLLGAAPFTVPPPGLFFTVIDRDPGGHLVLNPAVGFLHPAPIF